MLKTIKLTKYSLLLILVAGISWVISLPFIPNYIPMQYSFSGEVTWGTNKYFAGILLISVMIIIYLITILKPRIDPKNNVYIFFNKFYYTSLFFSEFLIYIVGVLLVLKSMNYTINLLVTMTCIIGLIFMFIGNFLPKVPTNWFVGIRNPWTLTNSDIWVKIHRKTGKLYILVGLILLAMGLTNTINWILIITIVIICSIYPHIRSFLIFRHFNSN